MERISWEYHSKEGLKIADDAELQNRMEDLKVSIETLDTSIGSLQTVIDASITSLRIVTEYMSSRFVTLERSALSVMGRSDNITLEVVKDFSLDHFGVDGEGYDRVTYGWLAYDGTYFYGASDTALLRWTTASSVVTELFTVAAGYYSAVKSAAYNPDDERIYFLKTGDMKLYYIDLADGTIHTGPTVSLTTDQAPWSLDMLNSIFYDRESSELTLIAYGSVAPICVVGSVNVTTGVMIADQWLDLVYIDTASVFWSVYHRGIIWYTKGEVLGQIIYGIIKFKNNSPVFSSIPSDDVADVNDWLIGMESVGDGDIGIYALTHYGRFIYLAPTASMPISDGGNVISIDATSLPLPTGAATAALQGTMVTALEKIDDLQDALRSKSLDVLITQIEEAGSIDTDDVAMTDAEAEIVVARADRKGLLIQNVDTADTVWIGPTGVAVGTGIELLPKQSTVLNHYTGSTASIFGICNAGKTANIRYLEAF